MSILNPNLPALAGDEYFGVRAVTQALNQGEGKGVRFPSTATESIEKIAAYLLPTGSQMHTVVDVYDADAALFDDDDIIPAMAVPTSNEVPVVLPLDFVVSECPSPDLSCVDYDATGYQFVDNAIYAITDLSGVGSDSCVEATAGAINQAVDLLFGSDTSYVDDRDGTTSVNPSLLRVASVEIVAVIANNDEITWGFQGIVKAGGTTRTSTTPETPILPNVGGDAGDAGLTFARYSWRFDFNPQYGRRWTNADITKLTTADGSIPWGLRIRSLGVPTGTVARRPIISSVMLRLNVLVERRLATGYVAASSKERGWREFPMLDVVDHSVQSWAKASGDNYLLLFAQAGGAGPCGIGTVDCASVLDHASDLYGTYRGVRVPYAFPVGAPSGNAGLHDWEPAFLCQLSGSTSVDGQPYPWGGGPAKTGDYEIDADHDVVQLISTQATASYGVATVLLKTTANQFGLAQQDAVCAVRLRRTSDDVLMAGPANVAPTDVKPDGKYHVVTVMFPSSASLVSGTSYYLELTSVSSVPWHTAGSVTRQPGDKVGLNIADDAATISAGGTADHGIYAGSSNTRLDFPYVVGTVPTAPSGLTIAAASVANRPALTGGSHPATVEYAALNWANTSLGGSFGYYEVSRSDDGGTTYATVAHITSETASYWPGREGPRNTPLYYRVRVVRADGAHSLWASFSAVTLVSGECVIVLASDSATDEGLLAYQDDGEGGRIWHEHQADQQRARDVLGRDDQFVFYPSSSDTESFDRILIVATQDPAIISGAVTPDRAVFDTILDFLHDRTLPYVAYCDGWSRVWLTSPLVADPRRDQPGDRYTAPTKFIQVAREPAVVVTDSPWAFGS